MRNVQMSVRASSIRVFSFWALAVTLTVIGTATAPRAENQNCASCAAKLDTVLPLAGPHTISNLAALAPAVKAAGQFATPATTASSTGESLLSFSPVFSPADPINWKIGDELPGAFQRPWVLASTTNFDPSFVTPYFQNGQFIDLPSAPWNRLPAGVTEADALQAIMGSTARSSAASVLPPATLFL